MSEHKKVHFFCEEDDFSLDILFYRQRDNPVDVIVRVFGSRGDSHLLRAPHQTIGKVY